EYLTMSGGDKCYYFNCNKTRKTSNNVFHLIPSSNQEVYRKWIINSGNIRLEGLSPKTLKKRFICSDHFEKQMYMNPNDPKSRLMSNAVPVKFSGLYK
ncbi:THAP-type domain-containing protein, partial [Aphis craccivora]